jgi:hypothetical protein
MKAHARKDRLAHRIRTLDRDGLIGTPRGCDLRLTALQEEMAKLRMDRSDDPVHHKRESWGRTKPGVDGVGETLSKRRADMEKMGTEILGKGRT